MKKLAILTIVTLLSACQDVSLYYQEKARVGSNFRAIFVLFTLSLLIQGCAGSHIYDQAKDVQASNIKTQYEVIKPAAFLETHRINLAALGTAERTVVANINQNLRNDMTWLLARHLSTGTFDRNDKKTDYTLGEQLLPDFTGMEAMGNTYSGKRLKKLGIHDLAVWEVATGINPENIKTLKQMAKTTRLRLHLLGWTEDWDCATTISQTTDEAAVAAFVEDGMRSSFNALFDAHKSNCKAVNAALREASKYLKLGILGVTHRKSLQNEQLLEKLRTERDRVAKRIENLTPPKSISSNESFIEEAQRQAGVIAGLLTGGADLATSIGFELGVAESRLDAIGLLLGAVNAGSLDGLSPEQMEVLDADEDFKKAAILAAGLPGLGNKVEALITLLRRPNARTDLAIQLAYQIARLDYLKKQKRLIEERAQLHQDLLQSYVREADFLYQIKDFLEKSGQKNKTLDEALLTSNDTQKYDLYNALINFDHAISVARAESDRIKTDLANFGFRANLLTDEYAINAWGALLNGPIEQLVAYHMAGIKSEEITQALAGLAGLGLLGFVALND